MKFTFDMRNCTWAAWSSSSTWAEGEKSYLSLVSVLWSANLRNLESEDIISDKNPKTRSHRDARKNLVVLLYLDLNYKLLNVEEKRAHLCPVWVPNDFKRTRSNRRKDHYLFQNENEKGEIERTKKVCNSKQ